MSPFGKSHANDCVTCAHEGEFAVVTCPDNPIYHPDDVGRRRLGILPSLNVQRCEWVGHAGRSLNHRRRIERRERIRRLGYSRRGKCNQCCDGRFCCSHANISNQVSPTSTYAMSRPRSPTPENPPTNSAAERSVPRLLGSELLLDAVHTCRQRVKPLIGLLCSTCGRLSRCVGLLRGLVDRVHSSFECADAIVHDSDMLVDIVFGCA